MGAFEDRTPPSGAGAEILLSAGPVLAGPDPRSFQVLPRGVLGGGEIFQGDHSPNDAQRKAWGYSASWMHHKGRNRHHFEYWTDYSLSGEGISGVEMPRKYVAEMFCDRLAASKVYRGDQFDPGDPYAFFLRGQKKRLLLHPATAALLEAMLRTLRDEGEDAAFAYIRREVLGKK